MKYFRPGELIRLYNVSDKTVRNWIEAAAQGKNELELWDNKGKMFIRDTLRNGIILDELVARGKKYRNGRAHKRVAPSSVFYNLYDQAEIIDIATNLEIARELPHTYRYRGEAGTFWNAYLHKLYKAGKDNILTSTINLLKFDAFYMGTLIRDCGQVNLVDIGVGNGLAIKEMLEHLGNSNKIGKYIGIDTSQCLLDTTEQNINAWLKGTVPIEKHLKDVTFERFGEILTKASPRGSDGTGTDINVFLFLGGLINNFRDPDQPLKTIRDSMGKDDFLLVSLKLDSKSSRRFFDFNLDDDKSQLSIHDRYLLDLLRIDPALYEVEQFFDEKQMCRLIQVKLKVALSIKFQLEHTEKIVELQKGERILLRRMRHYSASSLVDEFERNGFDVLQTTKTPDQAYVLLIAKVHRIEHTIPPQYEQA